MEKSYCVVILLEIPSVKYTVLNIGRKLWGLCTHGNNWFFQLKFGRTRATNMCYEATQTICLTDKLYSFYSRKSAGTSSSIGGWNQRFLYVLTVVRNGDKKISKNFGGSIFGSIDFLRC